MGEAIKTIVETVPEAIEAAATSLLGLLALLGILLSAVAAYLWREEPQGRQAAFGILAACCVAFALIAAILHESDDANAADSATPTPTAGPTSTGTDTSSPTPSSSASATSTATGFQWFSESHEGGFTVSDKAGVAFEIGVRDCGWAGHESGGYALFVNVAASDAYRPNADRFFLRPIRAEESFRLVESGLIKADGLSLPRKTGAAEFRDTDGNLVFPPVGESIEVTVLNDDGTAAIEPFTIAIDADTREITMQAERLEGGVATSKPCEQAAETAARTIGVLADANGDAGTEGNPATVSVVVFDPVDAGPLPGAGITIEVEDGHFQSSGTRLKAGRTNDDGEFSAVWIAPDPPGLFYVYAFEVRVSYEGYENAEARTSLSNNIPNLSFSQTAKLAIPPAKAIQVDELIGTQVSADCAEPSLTFRVESDVITYDAGGSAQQNADFFATFDGGVVPAGSVYYLDCG